jgi:hypothetical protein
MVRPSKGLGHVDGLGLEQLTRQRLRVILSTIAPSNGPLRVDEACRQLGIGPTYFDELRRRVLRGAGAAIAPRPMGRPRRLATSSVEDQALQRRITDLEQENALLQTRLELAQLALMRETRRVKSRGGCAAVGRRTRSAAQV